jgi:hypothetical protein
MTILQKTAGMSTTIAAFYRHSFVKLTAWLFHKILTHRVEPCAVQKLLEDEEKIDWLALRSNEDEIGLSSFSAAARDNFSCG